MGAVIWEVTLRTFSNAEDEADYAGTLLIVEMNYGATGFCALVVSGDSAS